MRIAIIGNGILGLQIAYKILKDSDSATISMIGPESHEGCASLAAAAMFNSMCEVESGTLSNPIERKKFEFNKASVQYWPGFLKEISSQIKLPLHYGFGTFLINNHVSDSLEDENFDAIVSAMQIYNEPFEFVNPNQIPFYDPSPQQRAGRAVYIPSEGWVNPIELIAALKEIIAGSNRVKFIDSSCESIHESSGKKIEYAKLSDGARVEADEFILCPGAGFSTIIDHSNLDAKFMKIFYGIGCTLLLQTEGTTLSNCVRTPNRGLACGVYSAPQNESQTVIGASNFISPIPSLRARVTSVYTLLKSAMEQINRNYYRSELVKVNVGWRPTSADTLPLIGKTSIDNLMVVTGTKRDGLHCSSLISEYVSEILLKGESKHDLSLFYPERERVKLFSREVAIETTVKHTLNAAYQHDFVPAKNRMTEQLEKYYRKDLNDLHDAVGAFDWGIPPELVDMYRYGHII